MKVMVTGHRPEKIGGHDKDNFVRVALRAAMRERLLVHAPEVTITGMALGIDQDFAAVCLDLKIPFIAAVPFAGQESMWPRESQEWYRYLLTLAHEVVYVSEPGYARDKMFIRNEWMVDHVGPDGVVIAVWDGSSGGTGSCVNYADRRKRKIDRIDPDAVVSGL
jgi:uncharacterized phage-like protein YoqJ